MTDHVVVVVPVFNAASYLAEALESVTSQGGIELDVVVVDDGSTDASADVARRFAPRVRLLQQPNRGIGAARNAGVQASRAQFVAFLDADDLWPAGRLRAMTEALKDAPKADIVCGRIRCFASPDLTSEELDRVVVPSGEQSGAGMAGATLVRREVFARNGWFDEALRVGEMVDWYLRARDAGIVEHQLDRLVLLRRIHRHNQGRLKTDARADYLRALRASIARRKGGRPA